MIIQCDHCNTKFNLDDAKVPDKGIKVRCAKCKHVFMVQKEISSEEPDLDFLLSGLGTQAPEAGKEALQNEETASLAAKESPIPAQVFGVTDEGSVESSGKSAEEQAPGGELGEDFFAKEEPPVQEKGGYDYGEFSFEEEVKAPSEEAASSESAGEEPGEFEFGEFPFEAESPQQPGAQPPAQELPREAEEIDFGARDFTVDEPSLPKFEETASAAERPAETGFSFGEEDVAPRDEGPTIEAKRDLTSASAETFDFGDISLPPVEEGGSEVLPSSIPAEAEKEPAMEPTDFATLDFAESKVVEPVTAKEELAKPEFDLSPGPVAGPQVEPSFVPPVPSAEEDELPPLAISTRKKGKSIFSIAVTTIVVMIVLAIAGAGFYVFKAGPTAFNKLGLSFLAKWVGIEVAEEGGITIKNAQGTFMVNRDAGEIFVVSGEAVNNFKKPRASIQVKATILGPKGEALAQKSAYCGNYISKEQLATLPMAKIEEAMGSPFGDSLANLGVPPGKGIPFVIVFSGVPKKAAEFNTEVVGSTGAGQ